MKNLFLLFTAVCMILLNSLPCLAETVSVSYNIINAGGEDYKGTYNYNGVILRRDINKINNFIWTGKEYILFDRYPKYIFYKSNDMIEWKELNEPNDLKTIIPLGKTPFKINFWGGKYIVFNSLHEGGAESISAINRGYEVPINPLWILDDNFNIIKEIDFGEPITAVGYINGKYYLQTQDYTNYKTDGNPINTIYTSDDALTWVEDDTLTDVPLWNGNQYALMFSGSLTDGDSPYTYSIEAVADNSMGNRTSIAYEEDTMNCFEQIDDLYISYKKYHSFGEYDESFKVSLDGVYWLDVLYPEWLKHNDLREESSLDHVIESVCNLINTENKILFQTSYRLFEYDKNELREVWHNVFGNTQTYVKFDGTLLGFETAPVIEDDRTLVPMRFLFEQMGADVEWDQATRTATATMDGTTVAFSIDNTTAEVNGAAATMDVPARLINDKTMVPLRFLSEKMGYTVTWDEATRTAVIE